MLWLSGGVSWHGWLQGLKYGFRYAFRQPNGWVTECEKGRLVMAGGGCWNYGFNIT